MTTGAVQKPACESPAPDSSWSRAVPVWPFKLARLLIQPLYERTGDELQLFTSFRMYHHSTTSAALHTPDSHHPCPSTGSSPTTAASGETYCSSSLSPSLTVDAGELINTSGLDLVEDVSLFPRLRQSLTLSLSCITDPSHSSAGQRSVGCP